jgi:MbtH protein
MIRTLLPGLRVLRRRRPRPANGTAPAIPFEAKPGAFFVLRSSRGQFSLWPGFAEVPAGWRVVQDQFAQWPGIAEVPAEWCVVLGPDTWQACLAFIEHSS